MNKIQCTKTTSKYRSTLVLISRQTVTNDFRPFLIPYGVFESHVGIQDTTGRPDPFPCFLFHAQLTSATGHTLSYICGRGLTYIYTGREEVPEGEGGDKMKKFMGTIGRVTIGEALRKEPNGEIWWAHIPRRVFRIHVYSTDDVPCTYIVDACYAFLMNGNDRDPHTAPILEKFASGLSFSILPTHVDNTCIDVRQLDSCQLHFQ